MNIYIYIYIYSIRRYGTMMEHDALHGKIWPDTGGRCRLRLWLIMSTAVSGLTADGRYGRNETDYTYLYVGDGSKPDYTHNWMING